MGVQDACPCVAVSHQLLRAKPFCTLVSIVREVVRIPLSKGMAGIVQANRKGAPHKHAQEAYADRFASDGVAIGMQPCGGDFLFIFCG